MSLDELLPSVRTLPRRDRLRLMHVLVVDLAREEDTPLLETGKNCPVWTPFDSYEAEGVLSRFLEEAEKAK